jgi:hypothetical protein
VKGVFVISRIEGVEVNDEGGRFKELHTGEEPTTIK